jgi:hypothetical protein
MSPTHKSAWQGTDWRRAIERAHSSRRCSARCKHSKRPCKGPAVRGKNVCRMHGARGGAPKGGRNGNYRNGRHTQEAKARRLAARVARWELRQLLADLKALGF